MQWEGSLGGQCKSLRAYMNSGGAEKSKIECAVVHKRGIDKTRGAKTVRLSVSVWWWAGQCMCCCV